MSKDFFKKLEEKTDGHPLKQRLEEELKEHVEDTIELRKQSIDQSIARLGTPDKIGGELKQIYFSVKRFFVYLAVYSVITIPVSLVLSYVLLNKFWIIVADGLAPFFIIIVSPLVGFIFSYSKKRFFGYSQKEILWYGMGVEVSKIILTMLLIVFTDTYYFFNNPDVRPFVLLLFFLQIVFGGVCSWAGGYIGKHVRQKNSSTINV
jgi:hypothetical protein